MAEVDRSSYVDSPYNLRQIAQAAYRSSFNNRFKTAARDVKHRARVESVTVWKVNYKEGVPEREKVHTYRIRIVSVKPDNSVSNYPVTINVDYLSIDAPVKLRCGTLSKYTGKDTMDVKGICGDFYFRFMQVYKSNGILFARDSTNHKAPLQTNPNNELGMCKHLWGAVQDLVKSSFMREGFDPVGDKKFLALFK